MTFSSEQIELVIQSVLRELKSRGVAISAAHPVNAPATVGSMLADKVITESTLAKANAAGRNLSVPPGAVITPSGHDYIRRHGVTISSRLTSAETAKTADNGVVIIVGNSPAASSAANAAGWGIVAAGCESDAAAKAVGELSSRVVCCGGEPSVTACLVNRDCNLRAAVITQTTDIELLYSIMNPQVICLDATGWTFAHLLRLLRHQSAVSDAIPDGWKETAGDNR